MERGLTLLMATALLLTPGVRGTAHLSFDPDGRVDVTRAGCGDTKACVEWPMDCDPAGNTSCLFTSLSGSPPSPPNGTDLSVELSGNSTGYVALGLTADASMGISLFFFCAQNNGSFFFRTMTRNNTSGSFAPSETIVSGIRSALNGSLIQCEFTVPGANATSTRDSDANMFLVLLATGTTNGTMIDTPSAPFLNRTVTVPTVNATTPTPTPTPATSMTTSGVSSFFNPHALLLPLSVLTLSVLKTT